MQRFCGIVASALAAICVAAANPASGQTPTSSPPSRYVPDPGVVTTRQAITPAGVQTVFDGFVHRVAFDPSGDLWVMSGKALYRLDVRSNAVKAEFKLPGDRGVRGFAVDPATGRAATTHVAGGVKLTIVDGGVATPTGETLAKNAVGSPIWANGKVLAPLLFDNALAVSDPAGGKPQLIRVGVAPVAVAYAAGLAYVANWGGEAAAANELSAPTGLDPQADRVRIDARGIARPGTISVVDLARGKVVATISVGRHPTALALDERRGRLFVANTNDDTVSVVDVKKRSVVRTIAIKPFSQKVAGVAPTSVALSPDGSRLYVACGGVNALAVYVAASGKLEGLIPTGWYPASVAVNAAGDHIAVGTLLGIGSGYADKDPTHRYVHANRGTAHVIPVPDAAQLASYTSAVVENNRMGETGKGFAGTASSAANPRAAAKAVPRRAGEPSLIEHVVYIVKENRTYDQVFGDLAKGNGDPSLVMFGEDVTPNQHRLAQDFVLLDNFYTSGGNSADGHQWVTQANEVSYTLWPGYQGRSYPFDGSDPLAYSARGFIWDAALARNKTVAVFGEYAPLISWDQKGRVELLRKWKAGEQIANDWETRSPIPPLDRVLYRKFPAYTMAIPDVVRARIFLNALKGYETAGAMPHLTIIQLPSNHTSGTTPGMTTPKAMVADNDLAVGQIVEGLSKSKFWSKMAIFIVEDDSQNGVDHVDGHRTVALAISPYVRRGSVDSTFYAHPSILKTIELQLGLPTLSLFDLIATDMRASFTDTPTLAPYTAITPKQDLLELNKQLAELSGPQKDGAIASAAMRWDVPDAVPTATLNRIVWHDVKGWDVPYPTPVSAVFSPYGGPDSEGDEEGESENEEEGAEESE